MSGCGRSTGRGSPGNVFAAMRSTSGSARSSRLLPARAGSTRPRRMRSPGAGGYDFAKTDETRTASQALWTPSALPSTIALAALPADFPDPRFQAPPLPLDQAVAADGAEYVLALRDGL